MNSRVPRTAISLLFGFASQAAAAELMGPAIVIDGDTLRVGGTVVRLEGIDAPEMRLDCRDKGGQTYLCGRSATRFLSHLIGNDEVRCSVVGQDSYDRALGVCAVAGREINAEMVRSGWALAFRRYSGRYVREEQQAEQTGAGLWSGTFTMPWDWRAGIVAETSNAPGDCVIKGNMSRSGECIYHMPFQQGYGRTRIDEGAGERWFCSEEEARKAGWRRALR